MPRRVFFAVGADRAPGGGLLPEAYTGRAQIERILPPGRREPGGRDRTVLDVSLEEALAPSAPAAVLEPEDKVRVFAVARPVRNRVMVRGNVWQPGRLEMAPGMTLSQAIGAAGGGGLRDEAYLLEAEIARLPEERREGELAVITRVPLDSSYVLDPTGYLRRPAAARGAEPLLQP